MLGALNNLLYNQKISMPFPCRSFIAFRLRSPPSRKRIPSPEKITSGTKRKREERGDRGKSRDIEKPKGGGKRRAEGAGLPDRATEKRKSELRQQLKEIEERLQAAKRRRGINQ